MDAPDSTILHSVEPSFELLARRLRELTIWIARLYWNLFVWIPLVAFTMLFAGLFVLVGFAEMINHPAFFWRDVPLIAMSLCFLGFHRVRVFFWVLLPCLVGWFSLVAVLLIPFLGPEYVVNTPLEKLLLGTAELLPPLVAALCIERVIDRRF